MSAPTLVDAIRGGGANVVYIFHVGGMPWAVSTHPVTTDYNATQRKNMFGWRCDDGGGNYLSDSVPVFPILKTPGKQTIRLLEDEAKIDDSGFTVEILDAPVVQPILWAHRDGDIIGLEGVHTICDPSQTEDIIRAQLASAVTKTDATIYVNQDYNDRLYTFLSTSPATFPLVWIGNECIAVESVTDGVLDEEFSINVLDRPCLRSTLLSSWPNVDQGEAVYVANAPIGGIAGRPAYLWAMQTVDDAPYGLPHLLRIGKVNPRWEIKDGIIRISVNGWNSWFDSEPKKNRLSAHLRGYTWSTNSAKADPETFNETWSYLCINECHTIPGDKQFVYFKPWEYIGSGTDYTLHIDNYEIFRKAVEQWLIDQVETTGYLHHTYGMADVGPVVKEYNDLAAYREVMLYGALPWLFGWGGLPNISSIVEPFYRNDIHISSFTVPLHQQSYTGSRAWGLSPSQWFDSAESWTYPWDRIGAPRYCLDYTSQVAIDAGQTYILVRSTNKDPDAWPLYSYTNEAIAPMNYFCGEKYRASYFIDWDWGRQGGDLTGNTLNTYSWFPIPKPDVAPGSFGTLFLDKTTDVALFEDDCPVTIGTTTAEINEIPTICDAGTAENAAGYQNALQLDDYDRPSGAPTTEQSEAIISWPGQEGTEKFKAGCYLAWIPGYAKEDPWVVSQSIKLNGKVSNIIRAMMGEVVTGYPVPGSLTMEGVPFGLDDATDGITAIIDWQSFADNTSNGVLSGFNRWWLINSEGLTLSNLFESVCKLCGITPTWEWNYANRQPAMRFKPASIINASQAWTSGSFTESDYCIDAKRFANIAPEKIISIVDYSFNMDREGKEYSGNYQFRAQANAQSSGFRPVTQIIKCPVSRVPDTDSIVTVEKIVNYLSGLVRRYSLPKHIVGIEMPIHAMFDATPGSDRTWTIDGIHNPRTGGVGIDELPARVTMTSVDLAKGRIAVEAYISGSRTYGWAPSALMATVTKVSNSKITGTFEANTFIDVSSGWKDWWFFDCYNYHLGLSAPEARGCSCGDYLVSVHQVGNTTVDPLLFDDCTLTFTDFATGAFQITGSLTAFNDGYDYVVDFSPYDHAIQPCQRKWLFMADSSGRLKDNDGVYTYGNRWV